MIHKLRPATIIGRKKIAEWKWRGDKKRETIPGDPLGMTTSVYENQAGLMDEIIGRPASGANRQHSAPVRDCRQAPGGEHRVRVIVPNNTEQEATYALARRLACWYCNEGIPPTRAMGQVLVDSWWTLDGYARAQPGFPPTGAYFWQPRPEEFPASPESVAWSSRCEKEMLSVTLPDGSVWEISSYIDEDSGWKIVGQLPSITTSPAVNAGTWLGSIRNGQLVPDESQQ